MAPLSNRVGATVKKAENKLCMHTGEHESQLRDCFHY